MSIGFSHIDIVGEKVRLRPVRAPDAGAAYHLVKNEAVLSTLAWDGPTNEEELRNTYRQWEEEVKTGEGCHMAIEQLEQPGAIGCIDIRFPGHPLRAVTPHLGCPSDRIKPTCVLRSCEGILFGNMGRRRGE